MRKLLARLGILSEAWMRRKDLSGDRSTDNWRTDEVTSSIVDDNRGAEGVAGRFISFAPLSEQFEAICGSHQLSADLRVVGGVSGILDDHELSVRPCAAELPRVGDRRLEVEASIH